MMVRGTAFRIVAISVITAALASLCVSTCNDLSAQMAEEDARRHHDSLYCVNIEEWMHVHALSDTEENHHARICACSVDSPMMVAELMVMYDVKSDKPSATPQVVVTLYGDSLTNSNVKLGWNDHRPALHRIAYAKENGRTQRYRFFLDPYEAMLDSITHHDSLTLQCLTHEHQPATFRFKLPKLEMEEGKMIEYKQMSK